MRLGDWLLGDEIGHGAMGVVYRARHATDGRVAAVKVLSPRLAAEERFVERFERESQATLALSHPRIVQVLDRGVSDGLPWYAMELVDGMNLRERMRTRRLDDAQLLRIAIGVCQGLEHAHARGVIHRDIKPENLLITASDEVRIADFGLARMFGDRWLELSRLSVSGGAVGTPFYMATEVLKGQTADGRADLYSLGVVLYEAMTGEVPVGRVRSLREMDPLIGPRIDSLVMGLLEPDPDARPRSATEVIDLVEDILRNKHYARPIQQRLPPEDTRVIQDHLRTSNRKRRRTSAIVGLLGLPFLAGGIAAMAVESGVTAFLALAACFICLGIAAVIHPKYTGACCPYCHGFRVRLVATGMMSQDCHLRCDDCHGQFGGAPKVAGATRRWLVAAGGIYLGIGLLARMESRPSPLSLTVIFVGGTLLLLAFASAVFSRPRQGEGTGGRTP